MYAAGGLTDSKLITKHITDHQNEALTYLLLRVCFVVFQSKGVEKPVQTGHIRYLGGERPHGGALPVRHGADHHGERW